MPVLSDPHRPDSEDTTAMTTIDTTPDSTPDTAPDSTRDTGHDTIGDPPTGAAVPSTPAPTPPDLTDWDDADERRPRRRWPWVVAGLGAAGAATVAGVVALDSGDDGADTAEPREIRSVTAEVRDLVEFTDLAGRMVYADATVLTASSEGVVTDVAADGSLVERGTVVYEVNAQPTIAFVGDVPMYRPLEEGATGDDVRMIEENLAALGHHTFDDDDGNMVDTGFVVDGVWDEATTDAVLRWQADVGLPETGTIATTDLVVIDGAALATDVVVETGSQLNPGSEILTLTTVAESTSGFAEHSGELDLLIPAGTEIQSGNVVYTVDEVPISAIVTDEEFTRDLAEGVEDGDDVLALETFLASLGFTADDELDVDDVFDEATEAAILEWEEELADAFEDAELTPDGELSLDEILVVEPGTIVGSPITYDSDTIASGTELWTSSSATATRIVETEIDVADQDQLVVGDVVDVEFPDDTIVQGVVISVATSSTTDPTNPDAEATLAVEIELSSVPENVADLNEVDVDVKLVDEIAQGVTSVPVSALVAVGDGTYVVEAVTTTGTTFLPVEPGMFSDGFVEVSGLQPGTQVVVPS